MRSLRTVFLAVAMALLLACNFPLFAPATQPVQVPSATPVATQTAIQLIPTIATSTALAVPSPTVTTVPTPSTPQVTPNTVNVNCRSGPDVAYDAVSALMFGNSAQVAGRSEDSSWWYVHDPANPGAFCWIAASVVTISGPQAGIPLVAPPAAIATRVTVDVTTPSSASCGGPNPVSFSGTITTNGAAKIKYQWEITGDKTNTTSPETLNFTSAGKKDVPDPGAYNVDCGKYKITLHVLNPNDISASKSFKVSGP
jgi:SH3-like domain-containing protein